MSAKPVFDITVVNMIPQPNSDEQQLDSEPNLSVNSQNPQVIVGSAFTFDYPNPLAPLYISKDGGQVWNAPGLLPAENGAYNDITIRFDGSGNLFAAFLHYDPSFLLAQLTVCRTSDLSTVTTIYDQNPAIQPYLMDQPFVQAATVKSGPLAGNSVVYVGINDFNNQPNTATILMSLEAAISSPVFKLVRLESRSTGAAMQDGPQIRTAIHSDGTVYAAFYGWRNLDSSYLVTSDVVVCRDDNWGWSPNPFTNLTDPGDGHSGMRVAKGINFTFNELLGQERTGGDLAIAVDPNNSSIVYLVWAEKISGVYTLHLIRSTDRGRTWSGDLLTIYNATNPAIAVNDSGVIGFLYQQLTMVSDIQRYETHIQVSSNAISWHDILLATTLANTPGDPEPLSMPYLGDYEYLLALGNNFYGIFSASNIPDLANFPNGVIYQRNHDFSTKQLFGTDGVTPKGLTIDPFFFRVTPDLCLSLVDRVNSLQTEITSLEKLVATAQNPIFEGILNAFISILKGFLTEAELKLYECRIVTT